MYSSKEYFVSFSRHAEETRSFLRIDVKDTVIDQG